MTATARSESVIGRLPPTACTSIRCTSEKPSRDPVLSDGSQATRNDLWIVRESGLGCAKSAWCGPGASDDDDEGRARVVAPPGGRAGMRTAGCLWRGRAAARV